MRWILISTLIPILFAATAAARPMPDERINKMITPRGPMGSASSDQVFADRADTLFLFASSGPGAFGSPGTSARGYNFDDSNTGYEATAGWIGVDRTGQLGEYWHLEDAHLVDGHATDISQAYQPWTPGDAVNDFAMWCGRADVCGWIDSDGYGNNWDQRLRIASADFNDSLLVEFAYTGCMEGEAFDFFQVLLEVTVGPETYLEEIEHNNIACEGLYREYELWVQPEDFPGAVSFGDVILRFSTDGAWSDEDGLFNSDYGACWIDNIVTRADGADIVRADLENGLLPETLTPETAPGAGNLAYLYSNLYSEDRCQINTTYAWAFFDPDIYSPEYPIPIIPYGPPYIDCDAQSPVLDSAHEAGDPLGQPLTLNANTQVNLHFWVYEDLPLDPLVFYSWSVAAKTESQDCVNAWKNDNTVYYAHTRQWLAHGGDGGINITHYVVESALGGIVEGLKIALNCVDMCDYWCNSQGDGEGHTPGPFFDNARLMLINASPVSWNVSEFHRFQDNFPEDSDDGQGGAAGKVRVDSAHELCPPCPANEIGDSTVVDLNMDLAGGVKEEFNSEAGELRPALYLWYQVLAGPHEGVISAAQADQDAGDGIWSPWAGSAIFDGETYGKLQADDAVVQGIPLPGRYAFDFADNYFLPGDIIHFFYRAEADDGTIQTRPRWAMAADPALRERYLLRCLPTEGSSILLCDDHLGVRDWWEEGLAYGGYHHQEHYDIYSTQASGSGQENGLAGRAGIEDLAQYSVILWDSGRLPSFTITDEDDKADDSALLTDFLVNQDRDTYLWVMGDEIANDLGALDEFVWQVLGVELMWDNFHYSDLNGELVPRVFGSHPALEYLGGDPWFWADGGCPVVANFSLVTPNPTLPWSIKSHDWELSSGVECAGIFNQDPDGNGLPTSPGGYINRVLFNPFSYSHVIDGGYGLRAGVDYARYYVGQVLLNLFNQIDAHDPDGVEPLPPRTKLNGIYPNPFNPTTTIGFALVSDEFVNLSVYDITGRRVTELVNGPMEAGDHEIAWDGVNGEGRRVASGAYFAKMNAGDYSATERMLMLK